jgi:hypothetical protein
VQAACARGAAQPLELARIVLDVNGVAFVAALGKPVDERDRMALGAAVRQRGSDEHCLQTGSLSRPTLWSGSAKRREREARFVCGSFKPS